MKKLSLYASLKQKGLRFKIRRLRRIWSRWWWGHSWIKKRQFRRNRFFRTAKGRGRIIFRRCRTKKWKIKSRPWKKKCTLMFYLVKGLPRWVRVWRAHARPFSPVFFSPTYYPPFCMSFHEPSSKYLRKYFRGRPFQSFYRQRRWHGAHSERSTAYFKKLIWLRTPARRRIMWFYFLWVHKREKRRAAFFLKRLKRKMFLRWRQRRQRRGRPSRWRRKRYKLRAKRLKWLARGKFWFAPRRGGRGVKSLVLTNFFRDSSFLNTHLEENVLETYEFRILRKKKIDFEYSRQLLWKCSVFFFLVRRNKDCRILVALVKNLFMFSYDLGLQLFFVQRIFKRWWILKLQFKLKARVKYLKFIKEFFVNHVAKKIWSYIVTPLFVKAQAKIMFKVTLFRFFWKALRKKRYYLFLKLLPNKLGVGRVFKDVKICSNFSNLEVDLFKNYNFVRKIKNFRDLLSGENPFLTRTYQNRMQKHGMLAKSNKHLLSGMNLIKQYIGYDYVFQQLVATKRLYTIINFRTKRTGRRGKLLLTSLSGALPVSQYRMILKWLLFAAGRLHEKNSIARYLAFFDICFKGRSLYRKRYFMKIFYYMRFMRRKWYFRKSRNRRFWRKVLKLRRRYFLFWPIYGNAVLTWRPTYPILRRRQRFKSFIKRRGKKKRVNLGSNKLLKDTLKGKKARKWKAPLVTRPGRVRSLRKKIRH